MNCPEEIPTTDYLRHILLEASRINYYLWLYLAQERRFFEARDFVRKNIDYPTPFDSLSRLYMGIRITEYGSNSFDCNDA